MRPCRDDKPGEKASLSFHINFNNYAKYWNLKIKWCSCQWFVHAMNFWVQVVEYIDRVIFSMIFAHFQTIGDFYHGGQKVPKPFSMCVWGGGGGGGGGGGVGVSRLHWAGGGGHPSSIYVKRGRAKTLPTELPASTRSSRFECVIRQFCNISQSSSFDICT